MRAALWVVLWATQLACADARVASPATPGADGGGQDATGAADVAATDAGASDAEPAADGALDASPRADAGTVDAAALDAALADAAAADAAPCTATVEDLGLPGRTLGAPTVARGAGGPTLIAWADFERDTVPGVLRADDGTRTTVADLGQRAPADPQPFCRPAAVATALGFTVVWIEQYLDAGFQRWRFRVVGVDTSGTRLSSTTFEPGDRVHYTDVEPRLFATSTDVLLAYRGRTADPLPVEHLTVRALSTSVVWTSTVGGPEQVAWGHGELVVATREGPDVRLRRFTAGGTELRPAIRTPRLSANAGPLRLAATPSGWTLLDADRVAQLDIDGTPRGASVAVERPRTLAAAPDDSLVFGGVATGQPAVWRIDAAGNETLALPFHTPTTVQTWHPDAAAWAGHPWLAAFTAPAALDDQVRLVTLCARGP
jgi:hypothetical protein